MESLWKGGMLLQGEIVHPCQAVQIISPSLPEDLKAADRSKRIGMDTWPFSIARRKSLTRKNSTCSARLYKGREEGLEEFKAIWKANTAVSAQPAQLARLAITRGHAEGVNSSLAFARCHHNSSCSKGSAQKAFLWMLKYSDLCRLDPGQDMLNYSLQFPWHSVLLKGRSSPLHQHVHSWLTSARFSPLLDRSHMPLQPPKVTLSESNPEQASHLFHQQPDSQKDPMQLAGEIQIWTPPPSLVMIN